ncbi:serine hydrolase domain-containing protein [Novosphingobium sp. EMRT-2]|uniref:serine hydrolase domain-containing protein n=1 Tax=Novosphingobium sp. EMRT-2 TaxID=2571749 RepID=UPI0026A25DC9
MKRLSMLAGLCLAAAVPHAALAAPPADIDARIEAIRQSSGTPGMAVAIVENGKVVLARGYGERRLGAPAKVDADTIFMIGSTGKALTATALATLVDAGKIGWDDKVVDHIPDFQMYDAWVTREMTIRDLLVHRSGLGLGAGDLLTVPRGSISREDLMRRLRYIKPATSFRSGYAYDNILYGVAGLLIERVSGQSWEDYMKAHVFAPAGMRDAAADFRTQTSAPNRAQPHGRVGMVRGDGPQVVLDERDQLGRAMAPAGLVAMSANDMARWLQIQLAGGALPEGGRLFSAAAARRCGRRSRRSRSPRRPTRSRRPRRRSMPMRWAGKCATTTARASSGMPAGCSASPRSCASFPRRTSVSPSR